MAKTIAFIGGGQMAEALISGMLASQTSQAVHMSVVEPDTKRRAHLETAFNVKTYATPTSIAVQGDVIVLAVKPQIMDGVLTELKPFCDGQLIITIAAGLPLAYYESRLGDRAPIIRVMPNTPALVLAGASALCRNKNVSDDSLEYAKTLLRAVGETCSVDESLMDAVTALSGSGPAYVFSFIESLIDGGVKMGLSHPIARQLAIQTVLGAALLAKETGEHPAVLKARVSSPGGTTISGLHTLEQHGFRGIIMSAIESAAKRSAELSAT